MNIINPGFGCLTLDGLRTTESIRFYPGHYMAVTKPDNTDTVDSWATIIGGELQACAALRGLQIRYNWRYLETAEGVYYFAKIVSDLVDLRLSASDIRKLCLIIVTKTFTDVSVVPDYILNDAKYEGGQYMHYGTAAGGYSMKWQNPYVVSRYIALVTALSQAVNGDGVAMKDNPQIAMITLQETAPGSDPALNLALHFSGLGAVQAGLVSAFPQTLVRQLVNYPGNYLADIIDNMLAAGVAALGFSDTLDDEPGLESHVGYPGIYPRVRTYKDTFVIAPENQRINYYWSKLSPYTSGYAPTVQQLLDFNKDPANWNAHIIVWTRSVVTGNSGTSFADYVNMQNLLKEAAQTSDPFGGLRYTRPALIS